VAAVAGAGVAGGELRAVVEVACVVVGADLVVATTLVTVVADPPPGDFDPVSSPPHAVSAPAITRRPTEAAVSAVRRRLPFGGGFASVFRAPTMLPLAPVREAP